MDHSSNFFTACKRGNVRIIKECLEKGEDVNKNFSRKWVSHTTPLLTILKYKKYDALLYLVKESNLDVNTLISEGILLLDYVLKELFYSADLIIPLVKRGANFFEHDNPPFLHGAARLIPLMENINSIDNEGNNSLSCAIWWSDKNQDFVFELLQREDLDINHKNDNGQTALHYFCRRCHKYNIKEILDIRRGDIDVNIKDNFGKTPIFHIHQNKVENYKYLIEAGADIFLLDRYNYTCLDNRNFSEEKKTEIIEYYQDFEDRKRRIKPAINRVFHKTEEEE